MATALATHLAFPGRGRPKALGEKVNKDSHFRRHMAALWVYGVGSTRETAELRHDLLQTAVGQVGTNDERRQHAGAEAARSRTLCILRFATLTGQREFRISTANMRSKNSFKA